MIAIHSTNPISIYNHTTIHSIHSSINAAITFNIFYGKEQQWSSTSPPPVSPPQPPFPALHYQSTLVQYNSFTEGGSDWRLFTTHFTQEFKWLKGKVENLTSEVRNLKKTIKDLNASLKLSLNSLHRGESPH